MLPCQMKCPRYFHPNAQPTSSFSWISSMPQFLWLVTPLKPILFVSVRFQGLLEDASNSSNQPGYTSPETHIHSLSKSRNSINSNHAISTSSEASTCNSFSHRNFQIIKGQYSLSHILLYPVAFSLNTSYVEQLHITVRMHNKLYVTSSTSSPQQF